LHLGRPQLQTLMYLLLSVAGHLTIFLTRTRGPFWSIRPARILWIAVLGTQTIATLIAVYGLFMTPLGWKLAGLVWGYAIVCALLTDRVKLLGYRFLDHGKAGEAKPVAKANQAKAEPKSDATADPKPEAKADTPKTDGKAGQPKPEAKADEPKPEAKAVAPKPEAGAEPGAQAETPSNMTSQIAGRAYELFEHRAPNAGTAAQDWQKAELELRKDKTNGQPKPEAKADDAKPEAKAEPKPEAKDKPQPDVSPQLIKRVHEAYEELGRKDVQSVQDWEKAHPELEEHESHK
jgi:H+-transporting ATPase